MVTPGIHCCGSAETSPCAMVMASGVSWLSGTGMMSVWVPRYVGAQALTMPASRR